MRRFRRKIFARVALPVLEVEGEQYLAPHTRLSRMIAIYEVNADGFERLDVLEVNSREAGELLECLAQHNVDMLVTYKIDEDLLSALAERGIRVFKSSSIHVGEVLRSLAKG